MFSWGELEDMRMTSKAQEMPTPRRRLTTFKEGLKHLRIGRIKELVGIRIGLAISEIARNIDFSIGWRPSSSAARGAKPTTVGQMYQRP
jgi:hypothetical protein